MVKNTIDTYSNDVEFGVSPTGICKNRVVDGYTIKGQESYYSLYCDSEKWVKEGWVDYICPQVYWTVDNNSASYEKVVKMWSEAVKGTDVKLYIGEGIYKEDVAGERSR